MAKRECMKVARVLTHRFNLQCLNCLISATDSIGTQWEILDIPRISSANQKSQKLSIFDRKLEGSHLPLCYHFDKR